MGQRDHMPTIEVRTAHQSYPNVVERGILDRVSEFIPKGVSIVFVVTTREVWALHGERFSAGLGAIRHIVLFFPGGEANKRLNAVEALAEQMVENGADRASFVIGFGGGIVTDISGFLAAIFMRGVGVLQIPTTLLAQVDAATGGKTGVNLVGGKNLAGSFHHPIAVLIDPEILSTLPPREYHAGLFEVIKCGIIRDPELFNLLAARAGDVLAMQPQLVDRLIWSAVRIKAEVVSADEREGDLRRILNFGHTIGHAIESETGYTRFLHGEAVAWGMLAATRVAQLTGALTNGDAERIQTAICQYGPLPPVTDLNPDHLLDRLTNDKKTIHGKIHFVLPVAIGTVKIVADIDRAIVKRAITETLQ